MSVRHSLRLRFALTFALVGAVLVLIHAVAILQLNRHQEAQLIDQIVSDEMEGLLQQYERIGSIDGPPYRKLQRFDVRADTQALSLRKWFRASWLVHGYATRGPEEQRQLPAELRELEPGFHDVSSGADRYRVEVDLSKADNRWPAPPYDRVPARGDRLEVRGRLTGNVLVATKVTHVETASTARLTGIVTALPGGGVLGTWTISLESGGQASFLVETASVVDTRSAPATVGVKVDVVAQESDGGRLSALSVRTDWPD